MLGVFQVAAPPSHNNVRFCECCSGCSEAQQGYFVVTEAERRFLSTKGSMMSH